MNAGCDHLLTSVAPTVDVIGIRILLALATIMMVWFGVHPNLSQVLCDPHRIEASQKVARRALVSTLRLGYKRYRIGFGL
jgi:hypothetical protein